MHVWACACTCYLLLLEHLTLASSSLPLKPYCIKYCCVFKFIVVDACQLCWYTLYRLYAKHVTTRTPPPQREGCEVRVAARRACRKRYNMSLDAVLASAIPLNLSVFIFCK